MGIDIQEPDEHSEALEDLAGGMPHVLIVAQPDGPDGFKVRLEMGGGIADLETVEALLRKTHAVVVSQLD